MNTTNNGQLIRDYLEVATPGRLQLDRLRTFLADDVVVDDPMMAFEGADNFIEALRATPSSGDAADSFTSTVQEVVGDGDVVAARILFEMMGQSVQFSQWFWLADGKIRRIQVIYDPRPFLELASAQQ